MTDNKYDNNYKTLTALLEFSELDEFQFSLMEPFCRLYGPNRSKADYRYMEYWLSSQTNSIRSCFLKGYLNELHGSPLEEMQFWLGYHTKKKD